MAKHVVQQGECISSIAYEYGFFPDTLWNLAENAELKQKRQDPNVLFPGDEVFIPDKREKTESGATEQKHRFKKKGVPAKMKVQMLVNDKPRANEEYKLYVDNVLIKEGKTKPDGFIEESIPPNAQKGEIVLIDKDGNQERYPFNFGTVDPIDTEEGVKGRLENLGYYKGDLEESIREFQSKQRLEETGTINEETKNKLKEIFGE